MSRSRTLLLALPLLLASFAGCGSDDGPAAPRSGPPATTSVEPTAPEPDVDAAADEELPSNAIELACPEFGRVVAVLTPPTAIVTAPDAAEPFEDEPFSNTSASDESAYYLGDNVYYFMSDNEDGTWNFGLPEDYEETCDQTSGRTTVQETLQPARLVEFSAPDCDRFATIPLDDLPPAGPLVDGGSDALYDLQCAWTKRPSTSDYTEPRTRSVRITVSPSEDYFPSEDGDDGLTETDDWSLAFEGPNTLGASFTFIARNAAGKDLTCSTEHIGSDAADVYTTFREAATRFCDEVLARATS